MTRDTSMTGPRPIRPADLWLPQTQPIEISVTLSSPASATVADHP